MNKVSLSKQWGYQVIEMFNDTWGIVHKDRLVASSLESKQAAERQAVELLSNNVDRLRTENTRLRKFVERVASGEPQAKVGSEKFGEWIARLASYELECEDQPHRTVRATATELEAILSEESSDDQKHEKQRPSDFPSDSLRSQAALREAKNQKFNKVFCRLLKSRLFSDILCRKRATIDDLEAILNDNKNNDAVIEIMPNGEVRVKREDPKIADHKPGSRGADYDRGYKIGLDCINRGMSRDECLNDHHPHFGEGIKAAYE